MTTYTAGNVTVTKNALKVYGKNTDWLANDIKATDLIILSGEPYEISEVNSSTEITLKIPYAGTNISAHAYTIIRIAPQVIAADLAKMLYACVTEHNSILVKYAEVIKEFIGVAKVIKNSRLYIDSDGDLSQDDTANQSHTGRDESSDIADDSDIDEILAILKS